MNNWNIFARGAAVSAIAIIATGVASAQVTTSSIRGAVVDQNGAPVTGATVTIMHQPTGSVSVATTSATGQFSSQNLRVGGPYSITITGEGFIPARADNVFTNLGESTDVNLTIERTDDTARMETVVVSGSALQVAQVATGPSSTYNLATLEDAPAMNRDIKDIIRIDPRVYVDEAFNDAINCAGANPRYNSLTVDGVRLNDNFGLNSNGYPTERIPFSYDSIQQVSVELAPFDVNYGSFTACNINAVTKTGSNEFHGGLFFDYTDDSLTGDETDGVKRDLGSFEEKRYGVNIGGPIIKDKLFFFGSYEKFEGANIFGKTPEDNGLSSALYQSVLDIAVNQYGYVAGGLPTSKAVEDEKFFGKLDWNINENHRAELTYTYNDGFNFSGSDYSSTSIPDGNHYYERGAKLENYTGAVYSDWTPNFNTEFRVSYLKLDNRQIPVAGLDGWGEVQVRVPMDLRSGTATIYLGADDSRHSNKLNYDLWNYKAAANYTMGDHLFTGGFEREEFSVFNLFIQQSLGEWRFSSPTDFANGDFNFFQYTNAAGTNDVNDGAANFGYEVNTLYLQDHWQLSDRLDITAGLRYDFYTSSDKPAYNANFEANYGFRNDSNMDGRDLLQPRFGFNYDWSNNIKLHGGFGLFSGGNPNVWISNNYSNNGVTLADYFAPSGMRNLADFTYTDTGRPFFDVPQEAIDAIASANGVGGVNALDPDFKIPSEWKFAFGAVADVDTGLPVLGNGLRVMADILYSKTNEAATVVPLSYVRTGTAPDGRPIYGGSTSDFLLTNAEEKGKSLVLSAAVSQQYDNGIDWSLGYAYTDAKDVNPMTSSVAFSNFANYTTYDPVNPTLATSDYEIAHRVTLQLGYEKEYFKGLKTKANLFGTANEGAPYSYVFSRNSTFESPFSSSRQLAYIPNGVDDPLISPLSDPDAVAALVHYINGNSDLENARGSIFTRNDAADDWWTKFDLKLSQELPGLRANDRAEAFITIENVGNLINPDWGILREHGFPGNAELYSAYIDNGQYVITSFNRDADQDSIVVSPSLWQVHFGVKYKF
ncbi:MAG: carboxypeptidase regulatory-like domain-containing protein [Hyphomonas sp.]|nr:carboxypeptidase regulatory-like domain-containing protein [Hyphomonas sp.]MCB9961086.1 carboxypeptidase regulatory-like domain-containing protein [Hyphomonas sp.]MCB9970377.1 carboxypeptidase regulatory-like domain-containing protein [Hyphomonas sp.]